MCTDYERLHLFQNQKKKEMFLFLFKISPLVADVDTGLEVSSVITNKRTLISIFLHLLEYP